MNLVTAIGLIVTGLFLLMNSVGYLKVLPLDGPFGKPLLKWGWPVVNILLGVLMLIGRF
jgi:hypothetical protein